MKFLIVSSRLFVFLFVLISGEILPLHCGQSWLSSETGENDQRGKYRVSLKKRSFTRLASKPLHKALLVLKMVHNDEDQSKTL